MNGEGGATRPLSFSPEEIWRCFRGGRGLKVDGVMKPGGETLATLLQVLSSQQSRTVIQVIAAALQDMGRNGDTILAHITPEEAAILDAVTDGASVNSDTGLLEFWFGGWDRDDDGNAYDNDAQSGYDAGEASDTQARENDRQSSFLDRRDRDRSGTRSKPGNDVLGGGRHDVENARRQQATQRPETGAQLNTAPPPLCIGRCG